MQFIKINDLSYKRCCHRFQIYRAGNEILARYIEYGCLERVSTIAQAKKLARVLHRRKC